MKNVAGTGPYGQIRSLTISINNDQAYLDNAPLGPIQKKRLAEAIERMRKERKRIRATLKKTSKK